MEKTVGNKQLNDLEIQQKIDQCYEELRQKTDFVPEIAIVLGSGLGNYAKQIKVEGEIPYSEIKGFPVSTAPGHDGRFIYGTIEGRKVICMKGRIHFYEGYSIYDVVLPLRVMRKTGADKLIVTNAAGGLNAKFKVGDFMLLTDHLSLFIKNPLIGPNIEEFGTRFPSMSHPYDAEMNDEMRTAAKRIGMTLQEGVYVQLSGPSYESSAELKALRMLGADAVGMSTVVETIAARHAGMRVCGVSCITNMAADLSNNEPNEQEVIDAGNAIAPKFERLITEFIKTMK
jgi:purine-nucleoside phosphorylase